MLRIVSIQTQGDLFPQLFAIIKVVKQPLMFDNQLKPMYQGRVLMNDSAINDPVLIAVLDEMALRDFKDRPQPNAGTWYISDRH